MVKSLMHKWAKVLAPVSGGLIALAFLILMLIPTYGALAPLNNALDQPEYLGVASGKDLVSDVSFLPEKILQYGLTIADFGSRIPLRLVSALFAIISVLAFYCLLRQWQAKRIALLGTILFASSSWFLHQARFAGPDILYIAALPLLLLAGAWLQDKRYDRLLPLSALMVGICLYIPGLWLFIVVGCVTMYKNLREAWAEISKKQRSFMLSVFIVTIVPLLYALISSASQITHWLGLPSREAFSLRMVADNLYSLPKELFIKGPDEPIKWLTGTPVLDIFTIALVVLGTYSYFKGSHPVRSRTLAGFTLLSIVLIALGGPVTLSILIPVIYLVATNGLALLLQQWFTVFPKNPFARALGILCILVAVGVTVVYHTTRYYVAWPHATSTKRVISTLQD